MVGLPHWQTQLELVAWNFNTTLFMVAVEAEGFPQIQAAIEQLILTETK